MSQGEYETGANPGHSIQRPRDAYDIILQRAMELGFGDIAKLGGVKFTIGTMCSGTDAPIFALRELQDAALACGQNNLFDFDHIFSVEIEPFKQAFIERCAKPTGAVFRDVVEVSDPEVAEATTAAGAKMPIPDAPDLLVAGSSCVDFSRQNAKRNHMLQNSCLEQNWQQFKDTGELGPVPATERDQVVKILAEMRSVFDTQGESTTTFVSILTYVYQRRPKIVVLENVAGAPWDQMAGFWLPLVGYQARFIKVDSKDFLVPQTRTRGYLVGVDQWRYQELSKPIVECWARLMDQRRWFKDGYPDVHKFLLHPFDCQILEARAVEDKRIAEHMSRENEGRMWAFEHEKIRREENLGTAHPYTGMDERGNLFPRDTCWQALVRSLGTRSQDLLDITFLRAANKGVDLAHKARSLDVGQGVDRMAGKFGLVGCILPDGDIFLCDQGRPILGSEALALQGLPIDRIIPSVESQYELHHMAGNAMTTTVVGPIILGALLAEISHTREGDDMDGLRTITNDDGTLDLPFSLRPSERSRVGTLVPVKFERCLEFSTSDFVSNSMDLLMAVYLKGRRYCPCGGYRKHYPETCLERCTVCHEVRCANCKGNPSHKFQALDVASVASAEETTQNLRRHLPGRFMFAGSFDSATDLLAKELLGDFEHDHNNHYAHLGLVLDGLRRMVNSVLYFDGVSIGNSIHILYKSTTGQVKLSIGESGVTWSVILRQDSIPKELSLATNQPVARAVISRSRHSIVPGPQDWEIYCPSPEVIDLACKVSKDHFHCRVAKPEQLNEALDSLTTHLTGHYDRSDHCGAPLGTLYAKLDETPVFHVIDSDPVSSAEEDKWILTYQAHRWDPEDHREVLCRFPLKWKSMITELCETEDEERLVSCTIPGTWVRALPSTTKTSASFRLARFPPQISQTLEHPIEELKLASGLQELSFPDSLMRPVLFLQLCLPIPYFDFSVRLLPQLWDTKEVHYRQNVEGWFRVNSHLQMDTLKSINFALNKLRQGFLPDDLKSGFVTDNIATFQHLDEGGHAPQIHRKWQDGRVVEIYEDPEEVQRLSAVLNRRPLPIELDAHFDKASATFSFRFLLNPTYLGHQAWTHLPKEGLEVGIRRSVPTATRVGCQVDVEFTDPTLKHLQPFGVAVCQDPAGVDDDFEEFQPPSFVKNGVSLRDTQQRSVKWMVKRESPDAQFVEKEIEEYLVPHTQIRLQGFAETVNRARGGVLAHDVGFGKTVMTLGLIDVMHDRSPDGSIQERMTWTGNRHRHLKATLIICPPQIVIQWHDEAKRFLGSDWNIAVINRARDVSEKKLGEADIVVLSSGCLMEPAYFSSLTEVTGVQSISGPDVLSKRNFNHWYQEALDVLGDLNDLPSRQGDALVSLRRNKLDSKEAAFKAATEKLITPSSRKQSKGKKAKTKQKSGADKPARTDKQLKKILTDTFKHGTLLQFFSFERVVLDEFSYENKSISVFFKSIVSGSKWILSGTPPLANLNQVCEIGDLVNVHIAREEASIPAYFPTITDGPQSSDLTAFEKVTSYSVPKSAQFSVDRHRQAENFLVDKVRRRETDTAQIGVLESVVISYMDAASSAVYAQFQQSLYNAKWDIDEVGEDIKAVMNVLLQRPAGNVAKARENLRTSIRNSIEVLLGQASSNLAPYVRQLRKRTGFDNDETAPSSQDLLAELIRVRDTELQNHKSMLKSQMDLVMYIAALVDKDENEIDAKINKVQKEKRMIYRSHLADFIRQMTGEPDDIGGYEIQDDLFSTLAPAA